MLLEGRFHLFHADSADGDLFLFIGKRLSTLPFTGFCSDIETEDNGIQQETSRAEKSAEPDSKRIREATESVSWHPPIRALSVYAIMVFLSTSTVWLYGKDIYLSNNRVSTSIKSVCYRIMVGVD